jgi:TPR repeat protein
VAAVAGQGGTGLTAYRRGHYQDAVELIAPLAHAGDPFAQFALGVMYDDGKGMAQDFSLAFKWYMRAAEQGLVDAQHMVGKFYSTGRGRPQNIYKAYIWFNLAAAGGYPTSATSRDTMAGQLSKSSRVKAQASAASWQRRHPRQFSCRQHACIHATWLSNPKYRILDRDFEQLEQ